MGSAILLSFLVFRFPSSMDSLETLLSVFLSMSTWSFLSCCVACDVSVAIVSSRRVVRVLGQPHYSGGPGGRRSLFGGVGEPVSDIR